MAAYYDITLTEAACLAPLGQALLEEETTIGRLKAEKVGFLRSVCLRVWAAQLQLIVKAHLGQLAVAGGTSRATAAHRAPCASRCRRFSGTLRISTHP